MIQSFRCPVCGNFNALGEPNCANCKQGFSYNCPVCGSPINNRYSNCPTCGTAFIWSLQIAQSLKPGEMMSVPPVKPIGQDTSPPRVVIMQTDVRTSITHRSIFWITLIVICIVIIAVLLFIDSLINSSR
jgi:predicted RNA-binding Zn-ribbon protein involved in translation (DUF1610 family)